MSATDGWDFRTATPAPDDHWSVQEIDQLNQDLEEMEVGYDQALKSADNWYSAYEAKNNALNKLERDFDSKVNAVNMALKDQCMVLLDLIEAYETSRKASPTNTTIEYRHNLTINELRRKGGLQV